MNNTLCRCHGVRKAGGAIMAATIEGAEGLSRLGGHGTAVDVLVLLSRRSERGARERITV